MSQMSFMYIQNLKNKIKVYISDREVYRENEIIVYIIYILKKNNSLKLRWMANTICIKQNILHKGENKSINMKQIPCA